MQTLKAPEAARFLNIDVATLYAGAKAGRIPGVKVGRSWVFVGVDLIQYLRAQYAVKSDSEGNPWGSIREKNAIDIGPSRAALARRLERALAPAPRKVRDKWKVR